MPTVLIYIDSSLYLNRALTQTVERALSAKQAGVSSIHFLEHDASLKERLETLFITTGNFCIAASAAAYPIVSRILATLHHDRLTATEETLHPASASRVKKRSFLLHGGNNTYNTLLVKSGESIPEILFEPEEPHASWQLLGDEAYLHRLKQHAVNNHYRFEYFQLIEGWYEIHTDLSSPLGNFLPYSGDYLLFPSKNIFDTCIEIFSERGETVSFAESCTGGLIAASFTSRSGSSAILEGSVVSYANRIKHQWLKVDETILEYPGAVSRECVREMAEGALKLTQGDIALSTSGIAGPTGGTAFKPVGTVYIAVADREGTDTEHLVLKGDRNYIQYQAMMHVIKVMIWKKKRIFEKFFNIS